MLTFTFIVTVSVTNEVDVTVACRFSLPGDAAVNPIDTASSKLRGTNKERFMVAATAKELCKRRYKSKIATASGKSVSETAHPKMFIYATLRDKRTHKRLVLVGGSTQLRWNQSQFLQQLLVYVHCCFVSCLFVCFFI